MTGYFPDKEIMQIRVPQTDRSFALPSRVTLSRAVAGQTPARSSLSCFIYKPCSQLSFLLEVSYQEFWSRPYGWATQWSAHVGVNREHEPSVIHKHIRGLLHSHMRHFSLVMVTACHICVRWIREQNSYVLSIVHGHLGAPPLGIWNILGSSNLNWLGNFQVKFKQKNSYVMKRAWTLGAQRGICSPAYRVLLSKGGIARYIYTNTHRHWFV